MNVQRHADRPMSRPLAGHIRVIASFQYPRRVAVAKVVKADAGQGSAHGSRFFALPNAQSVLLDVPSTPAWAHHLRRAAAST